MDSSKPRNNSEPWNDPKTCADAGLALLKRAVTELLKVHPQGLTKAAVGRALCLLPTEEFGQRNICAGLCSEFSWPKAPFTSPATAIEMAVPAEVRI